MADDSSSVKSIPLSFSSSSAICFGVSKSPGIFIVGFDVSGDSTGVASLKSFLLNPAFCKDNMIFSTVSRKSLLLVKTYERFNNGF